MEINDIKKALYIDNPKARFMKLTKGVMYYVAHLTDGTIVNFSVPTQDMGDASFYADMEAKLLIRYLV